MGPKLIKAEEMQSLPGTKFGPSEWLGIDQSMINTFADCTLDRQFIHIDEEAAKATPFGGTIAHGFLTLSLLVKLCEDLSVLPDNILMGVNYGFRQSPVFEACSSGQARSGAPRIYEALSKKMRAESWSSSWSLLRLRAKKRPRLSPSGSACCSLHNFSLKRV